MEKINYTLEYVKEFMKKKLNLIWDYFHYNN